MPIVQLEFNGSPYLGVFARASENLAVVPSALDEAVRLELGRALGVDAIPLTIGGSTIVGSVLALNARGAVVADFASDDEIQPLLDRGLTVARLPGKFNAAGNNILANDRGAIVNPDLGARAVELVAKTLGVEAVAGTLAGLKTVGSAAVATSKGALCHPKTTEPEIELLERVLGVEADIGTVNHGAPYIGAGIVATSKGAAIGRATTGPEMNRIEDALRLY
ncbi:MAG TPA: translation initiation factor IF-6 [Candidatus Thermoplasmatota archaeon]|nr:translation initiation factor IF-6 [Candidatus Thermoplasmatota archaeon]